MASVAQHRSMRGVQIHFIQCCMCRAETPALYTDEGKPDIPPTWRGMSASCCPKYEVYACSPRCAMQCGAELLRKHAGSEINVREVEAVVSTESVEEMLEDCTGAEDIPKDRGGPGFNQWELEFLESLRDQLADDSTLSEKQVTKLTELWDRI